MRIGILGGTFNPIHNAHLRIAEEVRDRLDLERVMFMPTASPPHKLLAGELSFKVRYEMVRLAIADNPCFTVSDLEGRRGGTSYSIHTLQELHGTFPSDEFFFIIGSDSFLDIGSWREYAEIFCLCNLVVVSRPGALADPLDQALPAAIADQFTYHVAEKRLEHCSGNSVYAVSGTLLDISSSEIRRLARQGRSIKYLLPAAVEQYIKEQRIYNDAR
ncbi:nicotinate-nucleotide adenylyltransferase [Geotalea sp. SG265]|uniref:nicotinate-nucleotide adenylyltransferase n=1 Tax=Geotalea sp. SG265 TaxID=2922867 RepID=UPI001FAED394